MIYAKPELQVEYLEMGWKEYGFSFEAFLRWRLIRITSVLRSNNATPDAAETPAVISVKDFPVHLQNRIQEDCDYTQFPVNPEWANSWADHFRSPGEAAEWHYRKMNLDDAVLMKSMRFRKAETAKATFEALKSNGLIPVIRRRGVKLTSMPKGLTEVTAGADQGLGAILRVCLDADFNLTEGQIDAILEHCPPTQLAQRSIGGARSRPNMGFSQQCLVYAEMIASAIHHIKSRFGALPEGGGSFSWLAFRCSVPNRGAVQYPESALRGLVDQAESLDQLKSFFLSFQQLAERTGTVGSWNANWDYADIGRVVYSVKTGVPHDWTDRDLGLAMYAGQLDDAEWVSPTPDDPNVYVMGYSEMMCRMGDHIVDLMEQEQNR